MCRRRRVHCCGARAACPFRRTPLFPPPLFPPASRAGRSVGRLICSASAAGANEFHLLVRRLDAHGARASPVLESRCAYPVTSHTIMHPACWSAMVRGVEGGALTGQHALPGAHFSPGSPLSLRLHESDFFVHPRHMYLRPPLSEIIARTQLTTRAAHRSAQWYAFSTLTRYSFSSPPAARQGCEHFCVHSVGLGRWSCGSVVPNLTLALYNTHKQGLPLDGPLTRVGVRLRGPLLKSSALTSVTSIFPPHRRGRELTGCDRLGCSQRNNTSLIVLIRTVSTLVSLVGVYTVC